MGRSRISERKVWKIDPQAREIWGQEMSEAGAQSRGPVLCHCCWPGSHTDPVLQVAAVQRARLSQGQWHWQRASSSFQHQLPAATQPLQVCPTVQNQLLQEGTCMQPLLSAAKPGSLYPCSLEPEAGEVLGLPWAPSSIYVHKVYHHLI